MDDENNIDDIMEGDQEGGESLVPEQPEDNDTPFSQPTDPIADASEDVDERIQDSREEPSPPEQDTGTDTQETYDAGP